MFVPAWFFLPGSLRTKLCLQCAAVCFGRCLDCVLLCCYSGFIYCEACFLKEEESPRDAARPGKGRWWSSEWPKVALGTGPSLGPVPVPGQRLPAASCRAFGADFCTVTKLSSRSFSFYFLFSSKIFRPQTIEPALGLGTLDVAVGSHPDGALCSEGNGKVQAAGLSYSQLYPQNAHLCCLVF